jgi:hypothetical protein
VYGTSQTWRSRHLKLSLSSYQLAFTSVPRIGFISHGAHLSATPADFAAGGGTWDGSICQVGFLFLCRAVKRIDWECGQCRRRSGRVAELRLAALRDGAGPPGIPDPAGTV